MTTEGIRGLGIAAFVLLALGIPLSCATTVSNRTGDTLDTSQYPPDIRDAYKVFAVRCSRCHTLARPLNARIRDPQQWVRYVQRMRLNPSSGINAKNGEVILRFLLYYMHQRERERGGQDPESELSPEQESPELQPLQPAAAEEAAEAKGSEQPMAPSTEGSNEVRMLDSRSSLTEAAQ